MSDAARNEQTKLLATGLNNIGVAFVVIGVVTPITAASFGVASAPHFSWSTGGFSVIWPTLDRQTRPAEPQAMNSGQIFVTFVIPAFVLTAAYLAMLANERAVKRSERTPPGE
ncbi:hypothetical protein [Methylobacterium sp. C25]|uniref:hypothetical protein n=1 Tax=Methylobacterium sp. C25 TaxID=2721622 RepID=UPI001F276051|nr:hypothetical protein [Methylobacterium sp. C25]